MTFKGSLLWSIHSKQAESSVECAQPLGYVFGTVHTWDRRMTDVVRLASAHLEACDMLALECDLTELQGGIPTEFVESTMPNNVSLGEARWSRLTEQVSRWLGIEAASYIDVNPMYLLMLLQQRLWSATDGSVDERLWHHATSHSIGLLGLETKMEHLSVLGSVGQRQQVDMLYDFVQDIPKARRQMVRMLHWYLRQDIRMLYLSTKRSLGSCRRMLLYDRNILMAARILEHCNNGIRIFAGVGAAHLYGYYGILALLKRENLSLKPVKLL